MKLFIPPLGTLLELTQDWSFDLFAEHRNQTLMAYLGDTRDTWKDSDKAIPASLPKGTLLKLDRIYIRQGQDDYDSVTFTAPDLRAMVNKNAWSQDVKLAKRVVRFWVKLEDANKIEADVVQ